MKGQWRVLLLFKGKYDGSGKSESIYTVVVKNLEVVEKCKYCPDNIGYERKVWKIKYPKGKKQFV